jgi:predicted dehydrogenase
LIRVGVIGVGYWGPNLVRTLHEIEGVEVARVADVQNGRLEFINRRFPRVTTTAVAHDVIHDDSIDAVFIATPPATHCRLALDSMNAGKHVFVEKPLTTNSSEAEAIVRLANCKGKKLAVGHLFLYHPAITAIRGLLAHGELGRLLYACSSRFNVGPPQTKVDALWDLAPHDVSIVLDLVGESPIQVNASGASFISDQFIETAYMNLAFPSGQMAQINVGWLTPAKTRSLLLVCEKKTVFYDDMAPVEKIRIYETAKDNRTDQNARRNNALAYGPGTITIPPLPAGEPLRLECEDFLNSIRNNTEPISSGQQAIEVVRVLEAASRSICSKLPQLREAMA